LCSHAPRRDPVRCWCAVVVREAFEIRTSHCTVPLYRAESETQTVTSLSGSRLDSRLSQTVTSVTLFTVLRPPPHESGLRAGASRGESRRGTTTAHSAVLPISGAAGVNQLPGRFKFKFKARVFKLYSSCRVCRAGRKIESAWPLLPEFQVALLAR
jgi:hypothetical protein